MHKGARCNLIQTGRVRYTQVVCVENLWLMVYNDHMVAFFAEHLMWLWVLVLVVCLIIEASTFSLTSIWAAVAAVPLVFISRTTLPLRWQVLVWVLLTIALIAITRPLALKKLNVPSKNKTNVNALVGQTVIVTKSISEFERGQAKSKNGVVWSASCADSAHQRTIAQGMLCKVCQVRGNQLLLDPLDTEISNDSSEQSNGSS